MKFTDEEIRAIVDKNTPPESRGYEIVTRPRDEDTVCHAILRWFKPKYELLAIVVSRDESAMPMMQFINGKCIPLFPYDDADERSWRNDVLTIAVADMRKELRSMGGSFKKGW
jgi:hypothetical protein